MAIKVKPFSDRHAIRQVIIALEFAVPLSSSALLKLDSEAGEQLRIELPKFSKQEAITVNIGHMHTGALSRVVGAQPELNGLSYEAMAKDGTTAWALIIDANQVIVACGEYDRWAGTLDRAVRYLSLVIPHVLGASPIKVIALQYLDEFTSVESRKDFKPTDLFDEKTSYLVPHSLKCNESWHSHFGYFDVAKPPLSQKRLTNVNVTAAELGAKMQVQINCTHKLILADALKSGNDLFAQDGLIVQALGDLHVENKRVVGNLLRDDVKDAIKFYGDKKVG